ncbi:polysaccharide biosynthesis C-terminal domain-containing protein, partial [Candidatus Peregrinibacteria bacterium]|nr:polysaccharide biosynthesis C-terminal domain-containing protein [Candidatus Peregrinibacteria bacterium]
GKQRQTLKVFFIGAVVNTALNLYIIPIYGIEGAALTTLAAESAVLIGIYLLVKKHIPVRILKHIWIPLISAAFMAIALADINFESLILTVTLGASIYFIVYFGLQQTSSKMLKKKSI